MSVLDNSTLSQGRSVRRGRTQTPNKTKETFPCIEDKRLSSRDPNNATNYSFPKNHNQSMNHDSHFPSLSTTYSNNVFDYGRGRPRTNNSSRNQPLRKAQAFKIGEFEFGHPVAKDGIQNYRVLKPTVVEMLVRESHRNLHDNSPSKKY